MVNLWGQLEQMEEERLVIKKQINKIQFLLSEMKSATLYKLCRDGNMTRVKA